MDKGDPAVCDGRNGKATRTRFSGLDAAHLRYAIENYDSAVSIATTKLSSVAMNLIAAISTSGSSAKKTGKRDRGRGAHRGVMTKSQSI
ncbi:hypothetical protein [Novosphingobium sp.]|uniref:hypothetical protein n=1 Tax=Novosphingobium sp. TaxID=1874826 RepID=UPI002624EBB4|nr:hypothetical protein [Novosphingobium sp.]